MDTKHQKRGKSHGNYYHGSSFRPTINSRMKRIEKNVDLSALADSSTEVLELALRDLEVELVSSFYRCFPAVRQGPKKRKEGKK